jgi:hypothetical protein
MQRPFSVREAQETGFLFIQPPLSEVCSCKEAAPTACIGGQSQIPYNCMFLEQSPISSHGYQ